MSAVVPPRPSAGSRIIGIVLVVPALLATLAQFVIPSALTLVNSFQSIDLRPGAEFVGLDNYAKYKSLLPSTLGIAFVLSVIAAAIGMLGGLIGTLAARGGALPRRITAAIVGILLTLYAPVGMVLALVVAAGTAGHGTATAMLAASLTAWLPVGLGAGALVGLLTGRPGHTRTGPLVVAGLVGLVATGAVGLQALAASAIMAPGVGPGRTLQVVALMLGAANLEFGGAAALQTLVLIVVGMLGIVAVIGIALSRLRLELTGPTSKHGNAIGWIGLALAIVALVGVLVVHRSWLAGLVAPLPQGIPPEAATRWFLNTWGISLISAVIQLVIAGAAGFGLGWLQPAGRHGSQWVLLLFAPWLLVGAAPLVLRHYLTAVRVVQDFRLLSLPPAWVSLPAMIAFTWLFAALHQGHHAARAGVGTTSTRSGLLTGAAGTVLIGSLVWLINAQSIAWPYISPQGPSSQTGPITLLRTVGFLPPRATVAPQWIATPIPVLIVLAIVIGIAAVVVTDRLTLAIGKDPATTVPDLAHGPATQQAHPSAPTAVPGRGDHRPVQDGR